MLPTRSLNQRLPEGRHSGPSRNWSPPTTLSIVAFAGTSCSKPGSNRTKLGFAGAFGLLGVACSGALLQAVAHITVAKRLIITSLLNVVFPVVQINKSDVMLREPVIQVKTLVSSASPNFL